MKTNLNLMPLKVFIIQQWFFILIEILDDSYEYEHSESELTPFKKEKSNLYPQFDLSGPIR